ncbi:glycosyl hydrolase catalytic core-domain-containing protein [Hysterangium stoloniferum]|nr:glycosyl hydrolase catalytic core-domain-containing protein [Hysterangium stoloniferum]
MAVTSRLISLFTFSALAALICSLQATPVNALTVEHVHRGVHHRGHDAIAKRKRATPSKCKPRSSPSNSSPSPASSPTPAPSPSPSPSSSDTPDPPASTPATSINTGGNNPLGLRNKQGAGWTLDTKFLPQYNPSIIYNWSPSCPGGLDQFNTICCPMFWGERDEGTWNEKIVNTGTVPKCIMGMNEPELPPEAQQADMSTTRAAQLWRQYFNPLAAKGTYTFSPATTSDPYGKVWMQQFFKECPDCHVDALATHWYDVDPQALIDYLNDMHTTFGRPIFLSEFACQNFNGGPQCKEDEVWNFEQKIKAFIDATPWMMAAAPFGIFTGSLPGGLAPLNALTNPDGSPNALGKAWYPAS